MKRETLQDALDQISDKHIAEAAQPVKRRFPLWFAATAALLTIIILAGAIAGPMLPGSKPRSPSATATDPYTFDIPDGYHLQYLTAAAEYPIMVPYPKESDFWEPGEIIHSNSEKYEQFDLAYDAWRQSYREQYDQPEGYADSAMDFFTQTTQVLLSNQDSSNVTCSPVNVYMALAMLAEVTGGQSRQEILGALGSDDLEALQTQAGHIWNAHYCADNATTLTLANSLWLDENLAYNEDTVQKLVNNYYASVLQGQLGSQKMNDALRSWINEQTGGLLQKQTEGLELPSESILALASTVYYRCRWDNSCEFSPEQNTEGVFHSPQSDRTVTYMNQTLGYGPYYWGDDYSAVYLQLEDSGRMWLILPDEGSTPADLLEQGVIAQILNEKQESTRIKVNLSLPKFDVSADLNLRNSMEALGIRSVFTQNADFSGILTTDTQQDQLSCAQHATRVAIDEEGITAAAYTVMADAGASPPPDEEVDLVLDRPFLFLVESRDGLPLFAGIVNEP